jgi:hypothetical protein
VTPLSIRQVSWLYRVVIGTVLALAVLLMSGVVSTTALAEPAMSQSSMAEKSSMAEMSGSSMATDLIFPAHLPAGSSSMMGCEGSCEPGPLDVCLAVLALVAAFVMAAHLVLRLVRGRPWVASVGGASRWVEWGPPPWSVLSLSQLSVLRV